MKIKLRLLAILGCLIGVVSIVMSVVTLGQRSWVIGAMVGGALAGISVAFLQPNSIS